MKEILLLTKKDPWADIGLKLAQRALGADKIEIIQGSKGEKFPLTPESCKGVKTVISFLNYWIVPGWLLDMAEQALNFHPAPPEYPGFNPYNFALYEEAPFYGVTCHHMTREIDSGKIIRTRSFPLYHPFDSVDSLKLRALMELIALFGEVLDMLALGQALPESEKTWARKPRSRKDFEALRMITPDMPEAEIRKRVRAFAYPGFPGAAIMVNGMEFLAPIPDKEPWA